MVEAVNRQSRQAGVSIVPVMRLRVARRSDRCVRLRNHLHRTLVDVADRVGPRAHGRSVTVRISVRVGDAVLAGSALGGSTTRRFASVPWAGRGCGRLMELLLVSQQQIATGKASGAFWALKWLLLRVGTLVSLEMLESRKRTLAGSADMRARLVGLWRGEVGRRFRGGIIHGR